jgi:hypothetical protein
MSKKNVKLTKGISGVSIFTLENISELNDVTLDSMQEFRVTKVSNVHFRRYGVRGRIHHLINSLELDKGIPNELFYDNFFKVNDKGQSPSLPSKNYNEFNFIKKLTAIPDGKVNWEQVKYYNFKLRNVSSYDDDVFGLDISLSKKSFRAQTTDLYLLSLKVEIKTISLPEEIDSSNKIQIFERIDSAINEEV